MIPFCFYTIFEASSVDTGKGHDVKGLVNWMKLSELPPKGKSGMVEMTLQVCIAVDAGEHTLKVFWRNPENTDIPTDLFSRTFSIKKEDELRGTRVAFSRIFPLGITSETRPFEPFVNHYPILLDGQQLTIAHLTVEYYPLHRAG